MLRRGPYTAGVSRKLDAVLEFAALPSSSLSSVAHPEHCLKFIPFLTAHPVFASVGATDPPFSDFSSSLAGLFLFGLFFLIGFFFLPSRAGTPGSGRPWLSVTRRARLCSELLHRVPAVSPVPLTSPDLCWQPDLLATCWMCVIYFVILLICETDI